MVDGVHRPQPSHRSAREIRAEYDKSAIFIYQAFCDEIACEALANGRFGRRFLRTRMTWIKPSFGWMLYRSSYASRIGQERILKIAVSHAGFVAILRAAKPTSFDSTLFESVTAWQTALASSESRYQWDPDRDVCLHRLDRRAIQVGIRGSLVHAYVDEWILSIQDRTDDAHEIRRLVESGATPPPLPDLPVYPVDDALRASLGMDALVR